MSDGNESDSSIGTEELNELNKQLDEHKKHTQNSIEYIEGSIDDLQMEFELERNECGSRD